MSMEYLLYITLKTVYIPISSNGFDNLLANVRFSSFLKHQTITILRESSCEEKGNRDEMKLVMLPLLLPKGK